MGWKLIYNFLIIYYMDIEQLVTDYEENAILNAPDTSVGRVNEEKIRKFIQDEIKKLS